MQVAKRYFFAKLYLKVFNVNSAPEVYVTLGVAGGGYMKEKGKCRGVMDV